MTTVTAHALEFSTSPRSVYTQKNPKYYQVTFPEPLDDDTGLADGDDAWSVSASEGVHYTTRTPVEEATRSDQAHNVSQTMGDTDTTATGATGVWSVAGRA